MADSRNKGHEGMRSNVCFSYHPVNLKLACIENAHLDTFVITRRKQRVKLVIDQPSGQDSCKYWPSLFFACLWTET